MSNVNMQQCVSIYTICHPQKQQVHHPFLDASALLHNTHPAAVKHKSPKSFKFKNSDTFLKHSKRTLHKAKTVRFHK